MKMVLFVLMLLRASIAWADDQPTVLHVARDGNDDWSGRLDAVNRDRTDGPFSTLERARDELRKPNLQGSATVLVHRGTYSIPQTLRFDKRDSGTADSPVIYRAAEGEKVILVGGSRVSGFSQHKGDVLVADVSGEALADVHFRQLYFEGRRQPLARYPNFDPDNPYGGGWAYADGEPVAMYSNLPGEDKHTLRYQPSDERHWSKPEEGEVFVFPRYNWWNNIVKIKSIDRSTRTISLVKDCSYAIRPRDRYYVQGIFEELDAPGEWYLDRAAHQLYFWPPGGVKSSEVSVFAPRLKTILDIRQAQHLTFQGFTFFCCGKTAIEIRDAHSCSIIANTIRGVGDYFGSGVMVKGGTNNRVLGNDIFDVGRDAISLDGGDRVTLKEAGHSAENNYLHHMGVDYKQGVGVLLRGCGSRASHNLIHDGPRWGIGFWGNKHTLEYNHIRHVCLETADTGAVYTGGRDWIGGRGSVVRYNHFHDILGYGQEDGRWVSPHFAWGVYLDDNTGGVDVIGNIIVGCLRGGIHLHNGRDNLIENNVFVDGKQQQIECSGWRGDGDRWKEHFSRMVDGFESVSNQPAWKSMRNMGTHPRDAVLPDGTTMSGNRFLRNIIYFHDRHSQYVKHRKMSFEHSTFDNNLLWNQGQPIETGSKVFGEDMSENLIVNGDFEQGKLGSMPAHWRIQIRPFPETTAGLIDSGDSGDRVLRIPASLNHDKPRDNYPVIVSEERPLPLGRGYRLRARMKATVKDASAALMLQSYVANTYFWSSRPQKIRVGTQWQEVEFTFKIPGPGDQGHHEKMKQFRARIDFPDQQGELLVDDVRLFQVELMDPWGSWLSLGNDIHSKVADPLFVDAERGDYRLRPSSPALKMGFQSIPFDKIGPYESRLRASWPIVEAPGAREHPLTTEH